MTTKKVQSFLKIAEDLCAKNSKVLSAVKEGNNNPPAIFKKLRNLGHDPSITTVRKALRILKDLGLVFVPKDQESEESQLTTLGENVLAEVQENWPEKLLSKSEVEKLSQETQRVMMTVKVEATV